MHPQPESYRGNCSTTGPRAVYDEAKRFGETLATLYWREFGVDARIVRIFNTYGERIDPADGRVLVNFVGQALREEPLTLYDDGQQTRAFCHVSDLVRGLLATMETDGLAGEVINLGCPDERTIADFAATVQRLCSPTVPIVRHPLTVNDPARRGPDIRKAQRLLVWTPSVAIEDGLRRTIASSRAELADVPAERRTAERRCRIEYRTAPTPSRCLRSPRSR